MSHALALCNLALLASPRNVDFAPDTRAFCRNTISFLVGQMYNIDYKSQDAEYKLASSRGERQSVER